MNRSDAKINEPRKVLKHPRGSNQNATFLGGRIMADSQPIPCADAQQVNETPVEYREIPGLPGYHVGSDGSVWTTKIVGRGGVGKVGPMRPIKQNVSPNGYLFVVFTVNDRSVTRQIHPLVLAAFVGPRPPGKCACHADGTRTNNRIDNLRWDTRSANERDKERHGTSNRGQRNGQSKLTAEQVEEIRSRRKAGESFTSISADFDVHCSHLSAICRGKNWKP